MLTRVPSDSATLIATPFSNATVSDKPAGSFITTAGVNDVPPPLADGDCEPEHASRGRNYGSLIKTDDVRWVRSIVDRARR